MRDARARELGADHGPPAARAADAAQSSAVPAEPHDAAPRQRRRSRSTSRRSTSFATASTACRASTSSAASTDCGSSPASTTSSTSTCPTDSPDRARAAGAGRDAARGLRPARLRRVEGHHRRAAATPTARRSTTASAIPTAAMVDNIEDVDTVVGWLAEIDAAARLRDLGDAVRRCSSSTRRAGCSATASSPRASVPSSTRSSASTG